MKKWLYRLILDNPKENRQEVALVRAESHFDAEERGREYAKLWESQGFEFSGADFVYEARLDAGEVVHVT